MAPSSDNTETSNSLKSDILSPAAKKIISENDINIQDLKGTGKDGRITKQDVLSASVAMGNGPGKRNSKRNLDYNYAKSSKIYSNF